MPTADQLDARIAEVVRKARLAEGLPPEQEVITRKATPAELAAAAERDTRRSRLPGADQPIRIHRDPPRAHYPTTNEEAPPMPGIEIGRDTIVPPVSRVAPHVRETRERLVMNPAPDRAAQPNPPKPSTTLERLLADGFVQVSPVGGSASAIAPVIKIGKGGILSLNKMAIETLGRIDRVALLVHPGTRQLALTAADKGPTVAVRHTRAGGATIAAKPVFRDLGILGAIHTRKATSPGPGILVIDLPKAGEGSR